jgi:hypothetical protein
MDNFLKSKTRLAFIQLIFENLSTKNDIFEIFTIFDVNYKSTSVENFNDKEQIKFEFNSNFLKKLIIFYYDYSKSENYIDSIILEWSLELEAETIFNEMNEVFKYDMFIEENKTFNQLIGGMNNLEKNIIAESMGINDDGKIEIYFNKKKWKMADIDTRLYILYSQLARDVLNLDYNEFDDNGNPISDGLKKPIIKTLKFFVEYLVFYHEKKDIYLNLRKWVSRLELFNNNDTINDRFFV